MLRRQFLSAMPFAAAVALAKTTPVQAAPAPVAAPRHKLHFDKNGRFRMLVISDLHYGPEHDPESHALIADMIKSEQPDFLLVNGDCIMGGDSKNMDQLKDAVAQVAYVMEREKLPWAVNMGNHDREHFPNTGLADEAFFAMFEAWPHNINAGWEPDITGVGNKNILLWTADGTKPLFNLWLVDSGKGAKDRSLRYEWVRHDQIAWYLKTQSALEKRFGRLSSLMFFHIPVREFITLGTSGKFSGTRGEGEGPSGVNSGLFAAVEERHDVIGMFCGHDHENSYIGKHRDVTLGFDGVAGLHNAYPIIPVEDPRNGKLRGGRMFEVTADNPHTVKTWIRHLDGTHGDALQLARTA